METIAKLLSLILVIPLQTLKGKTQEERVKDNYDKMNSLEFMKYEKMDRDALEQLAIAQNQMLCDDEPSFFDTHWYWITMYLLGIGTGAMGVFMYQAFQMLPWKNESQKFKF